MTVSDPNVHKVGGLQFRSVVLDGKAELAISVDVLPEGTVLPSAVIVSGDIDHSDIQGMAYWLSDLSSRVASS